MNVPVLLFIAFLFFFFFCLAFFIAKVLLFTWFLFNYALTAMLACYTHVITWLLGRTVTSEVVLDMSFMEHPDSFMHSAMLFICIAECWAILKCFVWLNVSYPRFRQIMLKTCCVILLIYFIATILQIAGFKVKAERHHQSSKRNFVYTY
jgi:hypothetical protein